jgi:hypothetical protein
MKYRMIRIFTLIGILALSQSSFCQDKKQDSGINQSTGTLEKSKKARFPGGEAKLWCYLVKNLDARIVSTRDLPDGSVFINFTIGPDGKISDITILRSFSKDVDEEIVRVINGMPDWTPAEQLVGYPKGKWVKVGFVYELSVKIPFVRTCEEKKK